MEVERDGDGGDGGGVTGRDLSSSGAVFSRFHYSKDAGEKVSASLLCDETGRNGTGEKFRNQNKKTRVTRRGESIGPRFPQPGKEQMYGAVYMLYGRKVTKVTARVTYPSLPARHVRPAKSRSVRSSESGESRNKTHNNFTSYSGRQFGVVERDNDIARYSGVRKSAKIFNVNSYVRTLTLLSNR